jgi:DNA-binding CsgD family transcriptional regulator
VRAEARTARFVDRRSERDALDQLVADVLAGESRVLVLRGEAGIGKSALLGYLGERVTGWHVVRAVGVESEMELPYSALHQLCVPILDHLDRLPVPQRDALATVFGRSEGAAPDRFLVGLATLSLFADVAERQPLACIVDDAQWLDHASALTLGFLARRLLAERIALVCAARTGIGDDVLAGVPALPIRGLDDRDARSLLLDSVHGVLDADVCDQIIAESRGNPLALLELPRTWNAAELAVGLGLLEGQAVPGKIERSFLQRVQQLPSDTQLLVLAAAAEPLGDPRLLHRATEALGIETAAADPAVNAELLTIGGRVEFAHPLVRSAVYRSASADDRRMVHRALADSTDAETDPDRRAWHRARATSRPDEEVAAELERSAGRAQARGGVAAAAAFLQRAVTLTVDPARQAERALVAAETSLQAGAFDAALELLAIAERGAVDSSQRARVDLLRAHVAFAAGLGRDAPPLLLKAASRLESLDLELARETYLTAWVAAVFAGRLAGADNLLETSRAARSLPPPPDITHPLHLLLDGLALLITDGHAVAAATLQRAARALTSIPLEDVLRWGWAATAATDAIWDFEGTRAIAVRHVELVRDAGALAHLTFPLAALGNVAIWSGDFATGASVVAEIESLAAATGARISPFQTLRLLALQGRGTEASTLIARTIERAAGEGQGLAETNAHWAAAVLCNGLARYDEAAAAARRATSDTLEPFISMWALPELVEATMRVHDPDSARDALERLAETTQPSSTDFGLGMEARCRALVSHGAAADDLYREAVDRLSRTPLRPELARAHLLHGEWLRREGRRVDAREQLRTAHDVFAEIGMEAFAERARRELSATGEKVRKRSVETRDELTPQEEQIARLARDGLSNPEIGAMLFLSPRTVEWHLRKVFAKLEISSRRQLSTALPEAELTVTST